MDDASPDRRFVVSRVFPPARKQVAVVRLLVASRQLAVFLRSLSRAKSAVGPDAREDLQFTLLATIASAKEAADAFRDADAKGCFHWAESIGEHGAEFRESLEILRAAADKHDPHSFYSRVLKDLRDTVGWHWSSAAISTALHELAAEEFAAFETYPSGAVAAVPIVSAIVMQAGLGKQRMPADMPGVIDELLTIQRHIILLANDQYFTLVRMFAGQEAG